MISKKNGFNLYDERFYKLNSKTVYASNSIIGFLFEIFNHKSVVDIGCGRGAWLVAAKNAGSELLHGIDGPWNSQSDMLDQSIHFEQADLGSDVNLPLAQKYDFCISVEVAEHLAPSHAKKFVSSLCAASDVVLFSAAFEGQGGTGHINENRHSYWANLFVQNGFYPFDIIRPRFWGDEKIDFWYKQNMFIYIREKSSAYSHAREQGFIPIDALAFMDAIHPELYKIKCDQTLSLGQIMKRLGPATIASLKHRFNIG